MTYVFFAIVICLVGLTLWRARSRGRFALASKRDALFELADTITILALARALLPWAAVGNWLWIVLMLMLAAAVVFIVLRWRDLPLQKPNAKRVWSWVSGILHGLVLAAIWVVLIS